MGPIITSSYNYDIGSSPPLSGMAYALEKDQRQNKGENKSGKWARN